MAKFDFKLGLQNFIFHLAHEKDWLWIDMLICLLAQFEVYTKLLKNRKLKDELETCDVCIGKNHATTATQSIPANDLYCQGCPYFTTSKIATLFFGSQCNGYCYYLDRGDFSFAHPTELLWDGCKECGINTEIDYDDEDVEEITMEDFSDFVPPEMEDVKVKTNGFNEYPGHINQN